MLAATSSPGLLGALGIDWKALVLNGVAFLIILALLSKYVYPVLTKALDAKADELTAAARLQAEAEKKLADAGHERHALLGAAQAAAEELTAAAQAEAAETIAAARARATTEAERIVAEAREQLAKDVATARHSLRSETAMLVAQATETLIGEKLDAGRDQTLIKRSLEQSK